MATYKDVKKFLEMASVDDVGMWYDTNRCISTNYLVSIHIYSSKRECNFILNDTIIGKLYFPSDGEVSMIRVDNGIADYDNMSLNTFNANSNCDHYPQDAVFNHDCSKAFKYAYAPTIAKIICYMANVGSTVNN